MRLRCPNCVRTLEFTGDPPLFCAYCGKGLKQAAEAITEPFEPTQVFQEQAARNQVAPPSSIGGYRILRRLGGGGMGDVYEAEEAISGQRVAIKLIAPDFAMSDTAVERFRQEGRLASLISHPRCVFVLAADEQAGRPYIVMELVSGKTLQEYVAERGPLPVEEAVTKILDVIDGLAEAHRLGVVHRDVKPSNCFMLEDGRLKIGDFGLSKSLVSSVDLTRTGTFLGTFLYASPEQIKGERVDFRTDIYSVSATLYFLLAGHAPFQGKDAAATLARTVSEAPTPLRRLRPDVPAALDRIIHRGLERTAERRWRSLDDLHAALGRFVPATLSMGAMGHGPELLSSISCCSPR
jgi:eukaryotic-like serine/threonine-protein kinase